MSIYESMIAIPNQILNLHYLKRYCKIVQIFNSRNLSIQKGFHSHHIIPKHFNGIDSKENRIIVTPREHFILHWLLSKSFPKSGMVVAFKSMCHGWGKYHGFRISSRVYENTILEANERCRETMLIRVERNLHNWQKQEDGSSWMSERTTNGLNPFSTREDGTNVNTDRIKSGTHNFLKQNQVKKECPVCHKTVTLAVYGRLHGDRCGQPIPRKECPHCHEMIVFNWFGRHVNKCELKALSLDQ